MTSLTKSVFTQYHKMTQFFNLQAFFHALGDRNQRMQKAIEHAFAPIVNGAISSLLSVVALTGSQFYFVFR